MCVQYVPISTSHKMMKMKGETKNIHAIAMLF